MHVPAVNLRAILEVRERISREGGVDLFLQFGRGFFYGERIRLHRYREGHLDDSLGHVGSTETDGSGQRDLLVFGRARHRARALVVPGIALDGDDLAVGGPGDARAPAHGLDAVRQGHVLRDGFGRIAVCIANGELLSCRLQGFCHCSLVPGDDASERGRELDGVLAFAGEHEGDARPTRAGVAAPARCVFGQEIRERDVTVGIVIGSGDAHRDCIGSRAELGFLHLHVHAVETQFGNLRLEHLVDVRVLAVDRAQAHAFAFQLRHDAGKRIAADDGRLPHQLSLGATAFRHDLQVLARCRIRDDKRCRSSTVEGLPRTTGYPHRR